MRRIVLCLLAFACSDPAAPGVGDRLDLHVIRHRVYNCRPNAFTIPFPSTPDPAICGTDTSVVSLSRDTIRAELTLAVLQASSPPTDTTWAADAAWTRTDCPLRPAVSCATDSGRDDGLVTRRARICPTPLGQYDPLVCVARQGEPYLVVAALIRMPELVSVFAAVTAWGPAEGQDVRWGSSLDGTRFADSLAFRLTPR